MVCRIEPENNVEMVLSAFVRGLGLPLVAVGNWGNGTYARQLAAKFRDKPCIYLLGPIYEIEELGVIRAHATVYVHGHSAGGTNPSLVEAMSLGLPVLAFDCIYNRVTTENSCLYFHDVDELSEKIRDYTENGLLSTGEKLRAIAQRRYKWKDIVVKYEKTIESAISAKRMIRRT
jgi:glycosyltransferase involved in cell wall biosynthesis